MDIVWTIFDVIAVALLVICAIRSIKNATQPGHYWAKRTCIKPGSGKGKNRVEPVYIETPLEDIHTPQEIREQQKSGRWL